MLRRTFLKHSFTTACALRTAGLYAAEPNLTFPTTPRDRLAVASYPFRKLLDPRSGTQRLESFPALVISRFAVKGIEPLSAHFPSTDQAYLTKFREAVVKAGAHIVNIPANPGGSLYDPDDRKRLASVETAKHWIDVAQFLGSPSIRIGLHGPATEPPDLGRTVQSLKAITAWGQQKKIIVNLENDDPHAEDAFFLLKVIAQTGSPYLRALPDFCNSMVEKHGDEMFNYAAVKAMFDKAYNICHAKDSERAGQTLYQVSMKRCFEIARDSGYRGYFSMEWEGAGEPFGGTERLIQESLRYL
jgi:sugar phosphate isomerase/epimerase